jgi:two-component system chemotaxis sensor kinase CheA
MSMRMVPLKPTFQKLARLVRDLAHKNGKLVEFVTEGEDTEIDRTMVDIVGDPLVHMVRNAVDHGIEFAAERMASGKSPSGTIRVSAYHAGGQVVVELTDDGRGLNRDKIAAKAVEKGLIASDKGMTEADIHNLIFAPGFSTADKITDLSGRGVGMDVVKRNVEALRGRCDIASTFGRGSTFSLRLPLTLAITDGMLVKVGGERYVVPTANIHMSFRPEAAMLSTVAGKGEVVTLRGEVMPVVRVHRLLNIPRAIERPTDALLMIVADGERRAALLVDELLGQQQVVAKALGVGTVPGVSGGAILGDGRVGLILDVREVVALGRQGGARDAAAPVRSVA